MHIHVHTLVDVSGVRHVRVLLAVAVSAHADGLASLDGRAVIVIARDLRPVHLPLLPRAHFLDDNHNNDM